MDVGTQWGWWRRKILTGPIYPPTLPVAMFINIQKTIRSGELDEDTVFWILSSSGTVQILLAIDIALGIQS